MSLLCEQDFGMIYRDHPIDMERGSRLQLRRSEAACCHFSVVVFWC